MFVAGEEGIRSENWFGVSLVEIWFKVVELRILLGEMGSIWTESTCWAR